MARKKPPAPEPPKPKRDRFGAHVFDESAGRRICIGKYPERSEAERAAIAKALQPGFRHAQVFESNPDNVDPEIQRWIDATD
jgi:hypothetical protein